MIYDLNDNVSFNFGGAFHEDNAGIARRPYPGGNR